MHAPVPQKTYFPTTRFNRMVEAYKARIPDLPLSAVKDYGEFVSRYEPAERRHVGTLADIVLRTEPEVGTYIVTTSGTTGAPVALPSQTWRNLSTESYPYQFASKLAERALTPNDVVANLFSAGGLGLLHEGFNRILESLCRTILGIGRIDTLPSEAYYLELLQRLSVNVLVGTPSSIIQTAQAAQRNGIRLPVTKVIFTGEILHQSSRRLLHAAWPGLQIFGLYGATEFGFAGIQTPDLPHDQYEVLKEWYFLEVDRSGDLLVTDLRTPSVPIIRFKVGDRATLTNSGGRSYLQVHGRSDERFNYMGNLVSADHIEKVVSGACQQSTSVQLKLERSSDGGDALTILLDAAVGPRTSTEEIRAAVLGIPEIREGLEKGVGTVVVHANQPFGTSRRGKRPRLLDFRR